MRFEKLRGSGKLQRLLYIFGVGDESKVSGVLNPQLLQTADRWQIYYEKTTNDIISNSFCPNKFRTET